MSAPSQEVPLEPRTLGLSRAPRVPRAVMRGYYEERLAGEALRQVYTIAPPRIARYLEAEVAFVIDHVRGARRGLELGCGYGRVMEAVAPHLGSLVGCDTSRCSLTLAKSYLRGLGNVALSLTDASRLAFHPASFDAVFCIQNGISAFGVDRTRLLAEAVRVTRGGGQILFSSYSPRIWDDRLSWFRAQSRAGLLGEIDEAQTGRGTIVCKDGFRATTVSGDEFADVFREAGLEPEIHEVDGSSLFCLARKA